MEVPLIGTGMPLSGGGEPQLVVDFNAAQVSKGALQPVHVRHVSTTIRRGQKHSDKKEVCGGSHVAVHVTVPR